MAKVVKENTEVKVEEVKGPEVWEPEVTVKDLAAQLEIQPKSLRSKLRKAGYKKAGKIWGWDKNSKELAEIIARFTKKEEPKKEEPKEEKAGK